MPRPNKKPICPIGLECPDFPKGCHCPNQEHCLNHTYSWSIPYTCYENQLVVNRHPYRYRWRKEAEGISHKLPPQCTLPSGSYTAIDYPHWEYEEMVRRIREEWEKVGWKEAIDIPQPRDFNDFLIKEGNCLTINFPVWFLHNNWLEHFHVIGFHEAVELPYEYDLEEKALIVGYGANDEAKALGWQPACNVWTNF